MICGGWLAGWRRLWLTMLKRIFDLLFAALLLLLLAPLLPVLYLLVRVKLGRPVIFRQQRPGLHGRPFTLYKFRTMTGDRDKKGNLLPDEIRLTRFGSFLRRYSLDELPEFVNVLKGDMSIVGPRPLLMKYLRFYTPEQARRHQVRPGITGWAQVQGRNSLAWEERFVCDVWYVDHHSWWLDLKIIWLTIIAVLRRQGITHGEHVSMPEFTGSRRGDVQ